MPDLYPYDRPDFDNELDDFHQSSNSISIFEAATVDFSELDREILRNTSLKHHIDENDAIWFVLLAGNRTAKEAAKNAILESLDEVRKTSLSLAETINYELKNNIASFAAEAGRTHAEIARWLQEDASPALERGMQKYADTTAAIIKLRFDDQNNILKELQNQINELKAIKSVKPTSGRDNSYHEKVVASSFPWPSLIWASTTIILFMIYHSL